MILFIIQTVLGLVALTIIPPALLLFIIAYRRNLIRGDETNKRIKVAYSFTAEFVMFGRVVGTKLGFCNDPFAYEFCELDIRLLVHVLVLLRRVFGLRFRLGGFANLIVRTNLLDEFVKKSGAEQIVILGAGFDSRSYRLTELNPNAKFFEVDAPATQKYKMEIVRKVHQRRIDLFVNPAYDQDKVVYVDCDFGEESFVEKLSAKGFDRSNSKTIVVMEGVAMYLTWEELEGTLRKVASLASGTVLGMSALDPPATFNASRPVPQAMKKYVGEGWKWWMKPSDTPAALFEPLGFNVLRSTKCSDGVREVPNLDNVRYTETDEQVIIMQVK